MRRFYLFILLILSLTATATTSPLQQRGAAGDDKSTDRSEIVRKNLAPVSKDVLKVKFAKAQEKTLSNGLTVLIIEDHRLPLVTLQYNIGGAGPIYEPAGAPGLASVTAAMLREGTKTRSSEQIAEQIAQLGASVGASSQFGSAVTAINASGLSDNFEQWFAIANDMLLNPSFPTVELNRLKARLKVQLTQQRASPNFLESERFNKAVY